MRSVLVEDGHPPTSTDVIRPDGSDAIGGRVLMLPDQWSGRAEQRDAASARRAVQATMTLNAGVVRSAESLRRADLDLQQVDAAVTGRDPARWEVRNLATVARALTVAAAARHESRGAHTRTDFPLTDPAQRHRLVVLAAQRAQAVSSTN